jgi:hypothetical protein
LRGDGTIINDLHELEYYNIFVNFGLWMWDLKGRNESSIKDMVGCEFLDGKGEGKKCQLLNLQKGIAAFVGIKLKHFYGLKFLSYFELHWCSKK